MGRGGFGEQERRETRPAGLLTTTACICIAIFSQREVFWRFLFLHGHFQRQRSLDGHGAWQFAHMACNSWHTPQVLTLDTEA